MSLSLSFCCCIFCCCVLFSFAVIIFQIGVRLRLLLFFFPIDERSVLFVRWFWRPFFEQVVFALGVFVIPSAGDVSPVVQRRFRLFD